MQSLRRTAAAVAVATTIIIIIIIIMASLHTRIYTWLLVLSFSSPVLSSLCSIQGRGSPCQNRRQVQTVSLCKHRTYGYQNPRLYLSPLHKMSMFKRQPVQIHSIRDQINFKTHRSTPHRATEAVK